MISPEEMERALRWMATTDGKLAELRVAVLRTEYLADVAESLAYRHLDGAGSIEDRKRAILLVPEVEKAKDAYFAAVREYERLRAQRKSAELVIEVWRTTEASRRVGNIT